MTEQFGKEKIYAAVFSVASNAFLVLTKLIIGVLSGSVSILSEAIHSAIDLLAALIAWFSVSRSSKPADEDHPFGHGKYENLSGFIEALLIFVAAIWIVKEAVHKFIKPSPIEFIGLGIAVMFISSVLNLLVSEWLMKIGKKTDSIALRADAWHLRTDVYTSAGVMAALLIYYTGKKLVPGINLSWIDPVAAIFVAILIIKAAFGLTMESSRDLLDSRLNPEEEEWIKNLARSKYPSISGFHALRTRKAGPFRFIELHMLVDSKMNVSDAHKITEDMEDAITNRIPYSYTTIHIEPCDGSCKESCINGCFIPEKERPQKNDLKGSVAT